jgi:transposase
MEFAMPIPLRDDFDAAELRREAKKSKDGGQARRLLARAAIHDGSRRREAAKIGGVTLQIVRDWVLKFNAHDPSRLIAGKAPGQTPRLTTEHRAALARMVEDGPIPAVHGAVRWRLVDLCQWVFEEYSVVVSTQTMSRELRPWTIASCQRGPNITPRRRPRSRILKKLPGAPGGNRARKGGRHRRHRNLVRRRGAHRTEEQDHTSLGKAGNAPFGPERPAHGLDLYLWRDLPEGGQGRRPDRAQVQHRGDAAASGRNRKGHQARTSWRPHARWHTSPKLDVPGNLTLLPLPAKCPELNPVGNVWEFMRNNWLSNRIFLNYDDIVDHCCDAWNTLRNQPSRVMSIGLRD